MKSNQSVMKKVLTCAIVRSYLVTWRNNSNLSLKVESKFSFYSREADNYQLHFIMLLQFLAPVLNGECQQINLVLALSLCLMPRSLPQYLTTSPPPPGHTPTIHIVIFSQFWNIHQFTPQNYAYWFFVVNRCANIVWGQ